jgi:hypothetical protein
MAPTMSGSRAYFARSESTFDYFEATRSYLKRWCVTLGTKAFAGDAVARHDIADEHSPEHSG